MCGGHCLLLAEVGSRQCMNECTVKPNCLGRQTWEMVDPLFSVVDHFLVVHPCWESVTKKSDRAYDLASEGCR